MTFIHNLVRNIPFKQRKYLRRFFYKVINLGFNYRPEEGLNSLRFKISLFYFFNPSLKARYANELKFLKEQSDINLSYSFIFPYSFVYDYQYDKVKVYRDVSKELYYVMHNGRKLYYNRSYKTEQDVKVGYFCIEIEQDRRSPHRYIDDSFKINNSDIVIDIGAAEGNFALDYIEDIKHLYIFEANVEWREALEATFEPWKEKVTIFSKFVSDNDDEENVSLNRIFGNVDVNFIKIDVEGAESSILRGSSSLLSKPNISLLVCTYHQQDDAVKIENELQSVGFTCSYSNGYMLFTLGTLRPPYFRNGLLKARKELL